MEWIVGRKPLPSYRDPTAQVGVQGGELTLSYYQSFQVRTSFAGYLPHESFCLFYSAIEYYIL